MHVHMHKLTCTYHVGAVLGASSKFQASNCQNTIDCLIDPILQEDIIFPSVYICNANLYRASFFKAIYENESDFTREYFKNEYFTGNNQTVEEKEKDESLLKIRNKMKKQLNYNVTKNFPVLWFAGHHCKDLILYAGKTKCSFHLVGKASGQLANANIDGDQLNPQTLQSCTFLKVGFPTESSFSIILKSIFQQQMQITIIYYMLQLRLDGATCLFEAVSNVCLGFKTPSSQAMHQQ